VPIGLLCNRANLRLVYAPRGESSGYLTFSVPQMTQVAGRPIFAALHMLLCDYRLFSADTKHRLPAILSESRKYQNEVSTQLAEQVLAALYELLRGFQAAHDQTKGKLLENALLENQNHVYQGLLTVLMRMVFVLYAEDRGLISTDAVYLNHYSLGNLFERLRADAGRHIDTMDQRYGAWAQVLSLFRVLHDGCKHKKFHIPPRRGHLFDPDGYPFLEGREYGTLAPPNDEPFQVPRVSDGVVYRVLRNLLILDGERLSYRTLDVEEIGSVYETMMGFTLQVAGGRSLAIKPKKAHGAPAVVNLEELLGQKPADRAKWLKEETEQELNADGSGKLKAATSVEELAAALEPKIAATATPQVVPKGSMLLQPSDERRRSGSHYTPRSLTEPIVQKALEPILIRLGALPPYPLEDGTLPPAPPYPKPEEILELSVCDPAMGSGAFLVEACRQLAEVLVKSWYAHNCLPSIPEDEDDLLYAKRLVAQRCLYGVDKNPMAVNLAKLSLWLATLAKDHPFTFLDHSLRCGDSLVGLTRKQIAAFSWEPDGGKQRELWAPIIEKRVKEALKTRRAILEAGDFEIPEKKRQKLAVADESLNLVRFIGNLAVAAFFAGDKPKEREAKRLDYLNKLVAYLGDSGSEAPNFSKRPTKEVEELYKPRIASGKKNVPRVQPFHWEIEFPEVFGKDHFGFDCIIGNPPFLGGRNLTAAAGEAYSDYVCNSKTEITGGADLVAHFFRQSYSLICINGSFGLIATNSIAQGDTRASGLRWICNHGGKIYSASRRTKWPGQAAVIISVVYVAKEPTQAIPCRLDGNVVERITAFLFHSGGNNDPVRLKACEGKSFVGSYVLGMGFTFDDTNPDASSLSEMEQLIEKNPRNQERIFPYIGGEEVNTSPTHSHHRYIINFGEMTEEEATQWPDLWKILEQKVKPERLTKDAKKYPRMVYEWWKYWNGRPDLYQSIEKVKRVLCTSRHSSQFSFSFLPVNSVFSDATIVFSLNKYSSLSFIQSRIHEIWVRFFGSSIKDDLRYTPSDCFETFPFPANWETSKELEATGGIYFEFRADLMVRNNEGLTKTYNRFHDPNENSADILKLRDLHGAMDRAVLDAYGWTDIKPTCEFLLDYRDEGDEEEAPTKGRHKKKPWRYRWPDEVRDEVLARLLDLNAKRAEEERLMGASATQVTKPAGKPRGRKPKTPGASDLFSKNDSDDDPGPAHSASRPQRSEIIRKPDAKEVAQRPTPVEELEQKVILSAFRRVARGKGWLDRLDLLREVAGVLGFQRLGSKTEEALRNSLRVAVRRGVVETDGPDQVRGNPLPLDELAIEHLEAFFKSALQKGLRTHRDLMPAAMQEYFGFSRLTDSLAEQAKRSITRCLRAGVISGQGNYIWREE
jgi:hypothetical protein